MIVHSLLQVRVYWCRKGTQPALILSNSYHIKKEKPLERFGAASDRLQVTVHVVDLVSAVRIGHEPLTRDSCHRGWTSDFFVLYEFGLPAAVPGCCEA